MKTKTEVLKNKIQNSLMLSAFKNRQHIPTKDKISAALKVPKMVSSMYGDGTDVKLSTVNSER